MIRKYWWVGLLAAGLYWEWHVAQVAMVPFTFALKHPLADSEELYRIWNGIGPGGK